MAINMLSHTTTDPDDFRGHLFGFTGDMWCMKSTLLPWRIDRLQVGSISVQHGWVGAPNLVIGEAAAGYFLYYFLTAGLPGSRLNGEVITAGSGVYLRHNAEFLLAHQHPHSWMTVSLKVPDTGETPIPSRAEQDTGIRDGWFSSISNAATSAVVDSVQEMLAAASVDNSFPSTRAGVIAEKILLRRLLQCGFPGTERSGSQKSLPGRPRFSRQSILARCHEYLLCMDAEPVSVSDLARHCEITPRTLYNAFQDILGMSPSKFLQYRQLYRVNRELRASDPKERSVTSILFDHGVWNMSHFSRRYRQLFGESMSQSLGSTR